MFGSLLMGTLQKFRQDETKIKDRELKKREIELKIEEKTEKERDDAKRKKMELFSEREKKKHELRVLQVGVAGWREIS
jgi:pinin